MPDGIEMTLDGVGKPRRQKKAESKAIARPLVIGDRTLDLDTLSGKDLRLAAVDALVRLSALKRQKTLREINKLVRTGKLPGDLRGLEPAVKAAAFRAHLRA